MENNLSKNLRKLAITKRLNFLIGSGASSPAISLMSQVKDPTAEEIANIQVSDKNLSDEEKEKIAKNERLIKEVKEVSKSLLNKTLDDTKKRN